MRIQRIILGSALLMLGGCQTIGGESMPTLTRTGEVKDVIVREGVDPTSVTVNPGDEIRWVNKRQGNELILILPTGNIGQVASMATIPGKNFIQITNSSFPTRQNFQP